MIDATRITFTHDQAEDRLRVDCTDGVSARILLLTRRVTRRLISLFVTSLARSSLALSKTPADMREEVIVLEHMSALMAPAAAGDGEASEEGAQPVRLDPALVAKVDLDILPTGFRLRFYAEDDLLVSLSLSRGDFHKLLSALDRKAAEAEWDVGEEAGWLRGAEERAMSPAGRSAS